MPKKVICFNREPFWGPLWELLWHAGAHYRGEEILAHPLVCLASTPELSSLVPGL